MHSVCEKVVPDFTDVMASSTSQSNQSNTFVGKDNSCVGAKDNLDEALEHMLHDAAEELDDGRLHPDEFKFTPWTWLVGIRNRRIALAFQAEQTVRRVWCILAMLATLSLGSFVEAVVVTADSSAYDFVYGSAVVWFICGGVCLLVALVIGLCLPRMSKMHHAIRLGTEIVFALHCTHVVVWMVVALNEDNRPGSDFFLMAVLVAGTSFIMTSVAATPLCNALFLVATTVVIVVSPDSDGIFCSRAILSLIWLFALNWIQASQAHQQFFIRLRYNTDRTEKAHCEAAVCAALNEKERSQAELMLEQRRHESQAYAAVNHCAKRVMHDTVGWMEAIQQEIVVNEANDNKSGCSSWLIKVDEIVNQVLAENRNGAAKCKLVLVRQQIAEGTYTPHPIPQNIRTWLRELYASIDIEVQDSIPQWISFDTLLLDICLDNAISNAYSHGKESGRIGMQVQLTGLRLTFLLHNEPGENHAKARILQAELQASSSGQHDLLQSKLYAENQIGSSASTFLGLGEISQAAAIMGAAATLRYEEDRVVFKLETQLDSTSLVPAATDIELPPLPKEVILICADDDKLPRAGYQGLRKKLGLPNERCLILGERHVEVKNLAQTVLDIGRRHSDRNVVCIFDQNMDNYAEGKFLGTTITANLRKSRFQGTIFIRSANDSVSDIATYRESGATGCLSKTCSMKDLAKDLMIKTYNALQMQSVPRNAVPARLPLVGNGNAQGQPIPCDNQHPSRRGSPKPHTGS